MTGPGEGAGVDRRGFVRTAAAGLAGAALGAAVPGAAGAAPADRGRRRGQETEPWGRLEAVGEGAWALVSTPLNDHPDARRTLCNGGIVAGGEGVLVVEAFGSPAGAAWMAEEAVRLTGRPPTHVALTHYHGDHVTGAVGFVESGARPSILATRTTRRLMAEQEAALPEDRTEARPLLLPDTVLPDDVHRELDLGGRTVRIDGLRGHTPSDIVLQVDDVVYPGDLVWTGLFPNYMDAIPTALAGSVRALRDRGAGTYVSGHGSLAAAADLDRYLDLLDHVEAAARSALEAGRPLADAAAEYEVPASLGSWHMFSPRYPEVAFRAWERELSG
jgi:glyoxylase-like metal-dependent hydrolase (beta-lactamase superfamily II)